VLSVKKPLVVLFNLWLLTGVFHAFSRRPTLSLFVKVVTSPRHGSLVEYECVQVMCNEFLFYISAVSLALDVR
jgi:hypothetical protein